METNYAEFRQIIAQVNDCCLAFIGNEKFDVGTSMANFSCGELLTGITVFVHSDAEVVDSYHFATYISEEENYAELKRFWEFVSENTEG